MSLTGENLKVKTKLTEEKLRERLRIYFTEGGVDHMVNECKEKDSFTDGSIVLIKDPNFEFSIIADAVYSKLFEEEDRHPVTINNISKGELKWRLGRYFDKDKVQFFIDVVESKMSFNNGEMFIIKDGDDNYSITTYNHPGYKRITSSEFNYEEMKEYLYPFIHNNLDIHFLNNVAEDTEEQLIIHNTIQENISVLNLDDETIGSVYKLCKSYNKYIDYLVAEITNLVCENVKQKVLKEKQIELADYFRIKIASQNDDEIIYEITRINE